MVSDKFLQFRISYPDFPTLSGSPLGSSTRVTLPSEVQLNFIGCPLDFIPKCGARTWVRGTAYELRPSPSFLIRPSGMVFNKLEEKLEVLELGRVVKQKQANYHMAQGRAIRRIVTLFDSIEDLIAENDRRHEEDNKDHTLEQVFRL
ncbi:hypothetical protein EDD22DRAFT_852771 [Suillus occidentalis]|nr:hypothetical protein EDD22DRAFT_852771 [Suillus occidentalis]